MKITAILFVVLLALTAHSARATEGACGEVDLRQTLGPTLNQGDTGHCFAHTSADLITAATGHRVSPLDLATSYVLSSSEMVTSSRNSAVINYLQEKPGFLAEWRKDRGEEPQNFTKEKILTDEGIYWTGGEEQHTIFLTNVFGLCDHNRLPDGEANYENYLKQINAYHQSRLLHHTYGPEELSEPIGEVKDPEARIAAHSFQNWVDQRCGRRWLPSRPLLPEAYAFAKDLKAFEKLNSLHALDSVDVNGKIFEKIDELLDHNQVVSIGYSSNDIMIRSKEYPSGDHASIIAARKTVRGKCLYYVRNSFGDSAEGYLARFAKQYESGGVWVKAKDLKSIYSVVWIR